MVDGIKGRTQVEQDERHELVTVDCMDDIVVHDEDSCLSRMVTTIRRLPGRQQAVLIAMVDKAPSHG